MPLRDASSALIDDAGAAISYRQQAHALRAQAEDTIAGPANKAVLQLADEYDWRAASMEASLVFRASGVDKISFSHAAE